MTEKGGPDQEQKKGAFSLNDLVGNSLGIVRAAMEKTMENARDRRQKDKAEVANKCSAIRGTILKLVKTPRHPEVQEELSRLTILLTSFEDWEDVDALNDIQLALTALSAKDSDREVGTNLEYARNIRKELEDQENRQTPGPYRYAYQLAGRSPIRAVLAGAGTSFVTIGLVSMGLFIAAVILRSNEFFTAYLSDVNLWLYFSLTGAAYGGSLTSIAIRLEEFSKIPRHDPLLVFLTGFYKPIIGILFAIFLFSVLQTELIKLSDWTAVKMKSTYFVIMLGFLCGFSERIAKDVISRLENKIAPNATKNQPSTSNKGAAS